MPEPKHTSPIVTTRQRQARVLRRTRRLHRYSGVTLSALFLVMAVTGVLLGWKKHAGESLMPSTKRGVSKEMTDWKPLAELGAIALDVIRPELGPEVRIDRMDARPGKGIVKVIFKGSDREVQLDAVTGEQLSLGTRHSDFIERLHDGTVVDDALGIPNGYFKVFYNTLMGSALVLFIVTGLWLWYGPRRMRK